MYGECHAHLMMDGENYKKAADRHREGVQDSAIEKALEAYQKRGIRFIRDGGDHLQVSKRARALAPLYGIDYRTPIFAIHKKGHYGGIVGHGFENFREYEGLLQEAKKQGADFIKIMISGILDFQAPDTLTEEGLSKDEIREMIHIAHEEGMAVMAHGNGNRTVWEAVQAGVDSIEHGYFQERTVLRELSDSSTIWIPTFSPVSNMIGCGRFSDRVLEEILDRQKECAADAIGYGAQVGLGSDAGAYLVPHGAGTETEWRYFQSLGIEERSLETCLKETERQIQLRFCRDSASLKA